MWSEGISSAFGVFGFGWVCERVGFGVGALCDFRGAVCCRLSTFGHECNRANGCGKYLSTECHVYKGRDPADAALHFIPFFLHAKQVTHSPRVRSTVFSVECFMRVRTMSRAHDILLHS